MAAWEIGNAVKMSFCHEIFIVNPIILILTPNTYDKRMHIDCSAENNFKSFPHALFTYF